jgi:RES domain-containing protein
MVRVWRLVKRKHLYVAFAGEGSRRWSGRWNSKGVRVVYASESLSLATLEILVHAPSYEVLKGFAAIPVDFDPDLSSIADNKDLPDNWRNDPAPSALKAIGDQWVKNQKSVILRVPSAIIPIEYNYLINPGHPDFKDLMINPAQEFIFDPRLKK